MKFCVDRSYSFQDIAYSTLYISYFEIGFKCPFTPQNLEFWGIVDL